jgi:hypothetical protein
MAKRDKSGQLIGQVSNRVQVKNPLTDRWVKIDTSTGRIVDQKKTSGPYKNIRKKG